MHIKVYVIDGWVYHGVERNGVLYLIHVMGRVGDLVRG